MKEPEQDPLESQLNAYFGARLDEEELEMLNQKLRDSPEARQRFWERASLEGALENWGRKRRGEVTALEEIRPSVPWWRQWPVVSGWAAAMIVLAMLMFQWNPEAGDEVVEENSDSSEIAKGSDDVDDLPKVETMSGTPVAVISQLVGVSSDIRYFEGQVFGAAEEIHFSEGMMEVTLYSGARVVLEGPARFVAQSDLEIAVMEGSVEAEVPDSAIGFKVVLPDGVITDFGTKFDFKVEGSQSSRIQVLEGEIELAGLEDDSEARRMFGGQAMTPDESGGFEKAEFQPLAVRESFSERTELATKSQMERWLKVCRSIDADESVLVHFSILSEEHGKNVIRNQSVRESAPKNGTVISADWCEGRWPGKSALAFRRPADRVRIDIPGEYPKATFVAWARVDGLPRDYNGLFYSESDIEGEAHWQLSSDGRYFFGVRPKGVRGISKFNRAFSEPVISPWLYGSWRMLATTYDALSRQVIHYVDGAEVSRKSMEETVPLRFGRATLGNYHHPVPVEPGNEEWKVDWGFRNWTGAIDEFILYSRVLDSEEISHLYEAGSVE